MMERMSNTEGNTELYEKALSELFEQLVALRSQYERAIAQSEQIESVNAEVQRITKLLQNTEISFTEYDDLTVRRLVESIQVCGKEKIIVTLKGGYQAEEMLRRKDVS
jgi:DNA-binding protein H-NS